MRLRAALGVIVTAALFVPLAVYGAPAIARSATTAASHQYGPTCGQYGSSGGQYGSSGNQYGPSCRQYRVTMCHRTGSWKHAWTMITVSSKSVKAHLRHGDKMSPCTTFVPTKHKHGRGHGKSHGHGHAHD